MSFSWMLEPPSQITMLSAGKLHALEKRGETWCGAGAAIALQQRDTNRVDLQVKSEPPIAGASIRWAHPLTNLRILGDHWERAYGDLEWRGIVPERVLPWYFLANDGACTHGCGVATNPAAFCHWQVDANGVTLHLDLRSGGTDVHLNGRTLSAAQIVIRHGEENETPFAAAHAFCRELCPEPRLPQHPVYGANDWYYAYGENSRETVLRDTAQTSELAGSTSNRPFMVIDAGWQYNRSCHGAPWELPNRKFGDMARIAEEIRAAGCRPGIWYRPLLTSEDFVGTPNAFPRDRFGNGHPCATGFILDPTVPEVRGRIREDAARFAQWGFELIKHDFTTFDLLGRYGMKMGGQVTPNGWRFSESTRTTAEVIADLYDTIRDGAGDATVIACNTIGHLAAGRFELQRTGDDVSGYEWERTRKMGINTLAFRAPQHDAFFAADADCVPVTKHVAWERNADWLDLVSRSGTPLFVSIDPQELTPERKTVIAEAFARASSAQATAEPLDWIESACPARWNCGGEIHEYHWKTGGGMDIPLGR